MCTYLVVHVAGGVHDSPTFSSKKWLGRKRARARIKRGFIRLFPRSAYESAYIQTMLRMNGVSVCLCECAFVSLVFDIHSST